jgi:hypothetical protein
MGVGSRAFAKRLADSLARRPHDQHLGGRRKALHECPGGGQALGRGWGLGDANHD